MIYTTYSPPVRSQRKISRFLFRPYMTLIYQEKIGRMNRKTSSQIEISHEAQIMDYFEDDSVWLIRKLKSFPSVPIL
jgi:hypothetical protein